MNVERPFHTTDKPARTPPASRATLSADVEARPWTTDARHPPENAAALVMRDGLNEPAPPTPSVFLPFLRQFNGLSTYHMIAAAVLPPLLRPSLSPK